VHEDVKTFVQHLHNPRAGIFDPEVTPRLMRTIGTDLPAAMWEASKRSGLLCIGIYDKMYTQEGGER